MAQAGDFNPAGEGERLRELQTFIRTLRLRTHLLANTSSNYFPLTAFLPYERERAPGELQHILDTVPEQTMWAYRASLHDLG